MKSRFFAGLALTLLISPMSLADTRPPWLPIHLASPFSPGQKWERIKDGRELAETFDQLGYSLKTVRERQTLPPVYTLSVPSGLSELLTGQKTDTLIRLMLPHAQKVNADILKVRYHLQALGRLGHAGAIERNWLDGLGREYGIGRGPDVNALLHRVDAVPISLILAQAIVESGWGTSRLARQGNALFGEHGPSPVDGDFMLSRNNKVKVARFDNIYHAVAGYVHTINAGRAYERIRKLRSEARATSREVDGHELAGGLGDYSEIGDQYVKRLRNLMAHYRLADYDPVRLDTTMPPLLLRVGDGTD